MVMSQSKRGLYDWMVQRVTAVYLILYFIPLLYLLLTSDASSYFIWKGLFQHVWMKVATIVALFAISFHAWVGLWTVFTDYVKCSKVRLSLQALVIFGLVVYVIWGVLAVWSI